MTYSTQPGTAGQPPVPYPTAVIGRAYGQTSTCGSGSTDCLPLVYTITSGSGLGSYSFTPNNFPTNFVTCNQSPSITYTCSSSSVAAAQSSYSSLSVTASDTANQSTPPGTLPSTAAGLQVNNPLSVNQPTPFASGQIPDAVTGRGYGTLNGGTNDLLYTVSSNEGLPPVTITALGFPAPISTCNGPQASSGTDSAVTLTCNSGAGTVSGGTSAGTVTASDSTANVSVPAATDASDSSHKRSDTLTVDPEIVIQNGSNLQFPNGEKNQPYSVLFSCQVGAGTCGGTGDPNNAAAHYTWAASSNNITSVAFTTTMPVLQPAGAATFAGTPSVVGSGETVVIGIADNGNATTPSCTTAGTCPASPTFSANILPSYAYVGANGNNSVDLFDTSGGVGAVGYVSTFTPPGGAANPNYVAASINGTDMFVADPVAHRLYIIDTPTSMLTENVTGLDILGGDTAAVAVGPQAVPTLGTSPDDVYAYVANAGTDNVQIVDANPANIATTFGTVIGAIAFSGGPYVGTGASDLKVAPTFLDSVARVTHAYVLRPGGHEVCVFDAEPSSTHFKTQITAAHGANGHGCISLLEAALTPSFIDVSPDGLYAFVTEGNGTDTGYLEVIDTNPNDSDTFERVIDAIDLAPATVTLAPAPDGSIVTFTGTLAPTPVTAGSLEVVAGAVTGFDNGSGLITGAGIDSGTVIYATGAVSVTFSSPPAALTSIQVSSLLVTTNPSGVRVSPDGQTVWVAGKDTSKLLGFETALVGTTQFSLAYHFFTPNPGGPDTPIGIAFRPDGAFGLATLSGTNFLLPFTTSAGTEVATTDVTTPYGIDHIPNAVLHITTTVLPAATHGQPYQSSIVAAGPNRYYTFTDVTPGAHGPTLAAFGLTLSPDGEVTGTVTPPGATPVTNTFYIQVTDQSLPVNNVVVQIVTLTVN
jgi:DNA-binding beta-propeller fold protein YncE